jgi:hypothetical protein
MAEAGTSTRRHVSVAKSIDNAYAWVVATRIFRMLFDDYNVLMEWKIFRRDDVMFRELKRLSRQVEQGCPRLKALQVAEDGTKGDPLVTRVIALRQRLTIMRIMVLVFVLVISIAYVFAIRIIHGHESTAPMDTKFWGFVGASTVLGLTIIWFAVRRIRYVGQDALISQLFSLCVLVESNPKMIDRPNFKRAVNRRIEACARKIEILPLTFGADGDPATRKELGTAAGEVATRFRRLKMIVVQGGHENQERLRSSLEQALLEIWAGKWFNLPREDYVPTGRASRTARTGWALLFIAGLAGLLAVAYFTTTGDLGSNVGTAMVPFLGIVLTFSLTKLGVKITALKQVADVSSEIAKVS